MIDLHGKTGVVADVLGDFRDPEKLAGHLAGLQAPLLHEVRCKRRALYAGDGCPSGDHLEVDPHEGWHGSVVR